MVLTGLRGVGKTVLLDTFKPIAQSRTWLWVGTDFSESASVSEETIATRLIADLATATSGIVLNESSQQSIGFGATTSTIPTTLNYDVLTSVYNRTPGLVADKLKAVLLLAWKAMNGLQNPPRGLVFAYDEAQNLSD